MIVDKLTIDAKDPGDSTPQNSNMQKIKRGYFGLLAGQRTVEIRDLWLRKIND